MDREKALEIGSLTFVFYIHSLPSKSHSAGKFEHQNTKQFVFLLHLGYWNFNVMDPSTCQRLIDRLTWKKWKFGFFTYLLSRGSFIQFHPLFLLSDGALTWFYYVPPSYVENRVVLLGFRRIFRLSSYNWEKFHSVWPVAFIFPKAGTGTEFNWVSVILWSLRLVFQGGKGFVRNTAAFARRVRGREADARPDAPLRVAPPQDPPKPRGPSPQRAALPKQGTSIAFINPDPLSKFGKTTFGLDTQVPWSCRNPVTPSSSSFQWLG